MSRINNAVRRIESERGIQTAIVELLQWHGWLVVELSQRVRVEGSIIGAPDVIAWKRGYDGITICLLCECKSVRGKLRQSQVEFHERVLSHLSPTLIYLVARSVEDVCAAIGVELK